jgi:hypothetical protein
MYREEEIVINPDFQRLFRWDIYQKSRLMESILLGIPIPPIFVFEDEDGKWELVDGLQRLSTLLEFMGLLKDPDTNSYMPPTALVGTKYLPSLQNCVWDVDMRVETDGGPQSPLDRSFQLFIRRSRLGVQILKRPSDAHTKYDLFQRLNSGGTVANPQELRNCIVVMIRRTFFVLLKELSSLPSFVSLIQITDDAKNAQRDMELLTRFIVYRYVIYDGRKDVEEYIDDGIVEVAEHGDMEVIRENFVTTFDLIERATGPDGLKRFEDGTHRGKVGLRAFEAIAVGISFNLDQILALATRRVL